MDEELKGAVLKEMRATGVASDARAFDLMDTFVAAEGVTLTAEDASGISAAVKTFAEKHPEVPRFPNIVGFTPKDRGAAIKTWLHEDRRWSDQTKLDRHIADVIAGRPHRRGNK